MQAPLGTGVYDWQTEAMTRRKYEINAQMRFYKQEYCGCSYSLRDNNLYRKMHGQPPVRIGGEEAGVRAHLLLALLRGVRLVVHDRLNVVKQAASHMYGALHVGRSAAAWPGSSPCEVREPL